MLSCISKTKIFIEFGKIIYADEVICYFAIKYGELISRYYCLEARNRLLIENNIRLTKALNAILERVKYLYCKPHNEKCIIYLFLL